MPKVSQQYRDARRDEIVEAALRAFHRRGFQATSVAEIIEESGLSAGAIYGHFKSKSDLVLAAATRVVGARMDDVATFATQDPMKPPAALIRVLMGGMLHDLGRPAMLVQLWGEAMTEPVLRELAQRVVRQLRSVYANYIALWHERQYGVSPAEAARTADEQVTLFLSCAQGYLLQSALLDDFDGEAFLTSLEKYLPR